MTNSPSKIHGKTEETKGSVKETIGKMLGNRSMQARGEAENAEGASEVHAAEMKRKAEAAKTGAKGDVKNLVGRVTGDDGLRAEGHADKAHGRYLGNTA